MDRKKLSLGFNIVFGCFLFFLFFLNSLPSSFGQSESNAAALIDLHNEVDKLVEEIERLRAEVNDLREKNRGEFSEVQEKMQKDGRLKIEMDNRLSKVESNESIRADEREADKEELATIFSRLALIEKAFEERNKIAALISKRQRAATSLHR